MKKFLISVGISILFFPCLAQKNYKLSFSTGVGQFAQTDLKELQRQIEVPWQKYDLKTINNFPVYYYYGAEFSRKINKTISLGIAYRFQSTGYKSSYADYSGSLKFEQTLKVHLTGLKTEYTVFEKDKLSASAQLRVYYSLSTIAFNSELKLQDQLQTPPLSPITFISRSIMIIPGLDLSYQVSKNIALSTGLGYSFDTKGDLTAKSNKNYKVYLDNNNEAQSNWSGLLLGVALNFLF